MTMSLCTWLVIVGAAGMQRAGAQSCDAKPDNKITFDRTIGGLGVDPKGTTAFSKGMRGISVDHAAGGYVYATDRGNHRVQVFDKEGAFKFTIGKSGSSGSGNDALNGAYGTSVDCAADGLVYVTDFNNHRVQVYTKLGKYTATIGSGQASYKTGEFRNPAGISVDSGAKCDNKAGYLYVIEWGNHRVQVFEKKAPFKFIKFIGVVDANGNPTHTHNSKFDIEEQKKGFASPTGIAVDGAKDGFLYVADSNNHRIKWFKKNGDYAYQGTQGKAKEHASNGQRGDGDGEFQSVFGIAVDPSNCGHVYVADTWNERLQIFTKAMQLIRIIGKADHHGCGQDGKGQCQDGQKAKDDEFSQLGGVTVDPAGPTVFASDSGNGRIQIYENPRLSKCKAGEYEAGTECKKCGKGLYARAGSGKCTKCAKGTFVDTEGAGACKVQAACGAGTRFIDSATAARACTACSVGGFRDASSHKEPKCKAQPACGTGTRYVASSLSKERECLSCKTVAYQPKEKHYDGQCILHPECEAGQYLGFSDPQNSGKAQGKCTDCSSGTFIAKAKHRYTKCKAHAKCATGQFLSKAGTATGDTTCTSHSAACTSSQYEATAATGDADRVCKALTRCGKGEFTSVAPTKSSNAECSPCLDETYNDRVPAPLMGKCLPQTQCKPGTFLEGASAEAAGVCTSCATGTFMDDVDHRVPECKPQGWCGAGKATSDDGAGNLVAMRKCSACPDDTYMPDAKHRSTECSTQTSCTIGELLAGATAQTKGTCEPCEAGTYMDFEAHREPVCKEQRSACEDGLLLGEDTITMLRPCGKTTTTTATTTTTTTTTTGTTTTTTTSTVTTIPAVEGTLATSGAGDATASGDPVSNTEQPAGATNQPAGVTEQPAVDGGDASAGSSGANDQLWAAEEGKSSTDLVLTGVTADEINVEKLQASVKAQVTSQVSGITAEEMTVRVRADPNNPDDLLVTVYYTDDVSTKQLDKVAKKFGQTSAGGQPVVEVTLEYAGGTEKAAGVQTAASAAESRGRTTPSPNTGAVSGKASGSGSGGDDGTTAAVVVVVLLFVGVVLGAAGYVYVKGKQNSDNTATQAFENPMYGDEQQQQFYNGGAAGADPTYAEPFAGADPTGQQAASGYMDVKAKATNEQGTGGYMDVQGKAPPATNDGFGSDDEDV